MKKKMDILSWLAQFKTGNDDNRDIALLPERFFVLPISVFDPALENLAKLRACLSTPGSICTEGTA